MQLVWEMKKEISSKRGKSMVSYSERVVDEEANKETAT
jgi:hypothetical protein